MDDIARRRFLKFLTASPLLSYTVAGRLQADETIDALQLPPYLIESPADALDVFDFHAVAQQNLPKSHYGYLATGTDGNETLIANREAFDRVYLRPNRMVDTSAVRLDTELLGHSLRSPIVIAPVGSQKAFHPDGELATARAARAQDHLQILSNVASTPIEEVVRARGEPVWSQLYSTKVWSTVTTMLRRAEDAGAEVVVPTIDLNSGSNRVLLGQFARADERDCSACHGDDPAAWFAQTKPMYEGTDTSELDLDMSHMTWDYVGRLRDTTSMKIVLKGIVTAEDARNCLKYGVDAVYVSNHGGRAEASGRGSLDSLAEVVDAVDGRLPVLFDSGVRRGTDIFKALAIGADAVGIGRAYMWGLSAFGEAGVSKVLEMLKAELAMVMGQMGVRSIAGIGRQHIGVHA
jgi:4-hydroxymandelate oxidase